MSNNFNFVLDDFKNSNRNNFSVDRCCNRHRDTNIGLEKTCTGAVRNLTLVLTLAAGCLWNESDSSAGCDLLNGDREVEARCNHTNNRIERKKNIYAKKHMQKVFDPTLELGAAFIASDDYKKAREQHRGNGRFRCTIEVPEFDLTLKRQEILRRWNDLSYRATLTQTVSGSTSFERPPAVVLAAGVQPPTIADLLFQQNTENTTIRHMQEDSFTNAATALAEEGAYQESSWDLSEVDSPVRKIGVIGRMTDEQFEDSDAVQNYVNNRLPFMVSLVEDSTLLNGTGLNNQIKGFLNQTGVLTADCGNYSNPMDAFHKIKTTLEAQSFVHPTHYVLHPMDWENLVLQKDSVGRYHSGGPVGYLQNGQPSTAFQTVPILWGKPVILTTVITRGTAVCGDFSGRFSTLWRRKGLTVEASNCDGSDFQYGRVALRATVRNALAVYRPPCVIQMTNIPIV